MRRGGAMSYWTSNGALREGPFTAEELVWKRRGDLETLVCRGKSPAADRRAWRVAWLYPELDKLRQILPYS